MTDKERLEEILSDLKMKPVDFARELKPDIRPNWIYDITNEKLSTAGNPTGISKEMSKLIVEKFPQYNIAWVCLGVGDKYTKTSPAPVEARDGSTVEVIAEEVMSLLQEIKDEQKKLAINYQTMSDLLSQEKNKPEDAAPNLTNEQITAAVQQMIDQGSFGPKQSDLSREELEAIASGKTPSKKKEAEDKSGALSDQGKVGKLHEAMDSKEMVKPIKKGGASRKSK